MKKENENKYYNIEDEINFEKMNNFKKFNLNIKKNIQNKNQDIKYSNSDKNYFNNIIKTEKNVSLLNETDVKKNLDYYNSFDAKKFDQLNNFPEYKYNNEKSLTLSPITTVDKLSGILVSANESVVRFFENTTGNDYLVTLEGNFNQKNP